MNARQRFQRTWGIFATEEFVFRRYLVGPACWSESASKTGHKLFLCSAVYLNLRLRSVLSTRIAAARLSKRLKRSADTVGVRTESWFSLTIVELRAAVALGKRKRSLSFDLAET